MKKKINSILMLALCCAMAFCAFGCGEATTIAIDNPLPWVLTGKLYEKCEYALEEYTAVGEEKIDLLASGSMTFILEDGETEGTSKLTMAVERKYNDNALNGASKNVTDTASSVVVFDKNTLAPISSEKTVKRGERAGVKDTSYTVKVDYTKQTAELTTQADGTKSLALSLSGQYFDNEQLYYVVRAFTNLTLSGSQYFTLFQPLDYFNYDVKTYSMQLGVAAESRTVTLDGWKNSKTYNMPTTDDGKPTPACYVATIGINSSNLGTNIEATFAVEPFKISETLSARKVLTGITTTSYPTDYLTAHKTFYKLIDYTSAIA